MAEQIVYVRGAFPPNDFHALAGSDFTEDARGILALAPSILSSLAAELNTYSSFLDQAGLWKLIHSHAVDPEKAKLIIRFILNLERVLNQSGLSAEDFVKRFPALLQEHSARAGDAPEGEPGSPPLGPDEIEELTRRVSMLFGPKSARSRQRKAERLLKATGHPLEELQIICDLRPVFDDERAQVDGMFPITTLRVVATDDSGMPIALESRLSLPQLEDLKTKATLALLKLQSLHEMLNQRGIALPNLERGQGGGRS